MGLLDLLKGFLNKDRKKYYSNNNFSVENKLLHLWEDDYLMIEFVSDENLEFIKSETTRILNFGNENFDGNAYSEVTRISTKPFPTENLNLDFLLFSNKILQLGFKEVKEFVMQDVGLVINSDKSKPYGDNDYAIVFDLIQNKIQNIWFTGLVKNNIEKEKIVKFLEFLGENYKFISVDWYQCKYYNLKNNVEILNFVNNTCFIQTNN